MKQSSDEFVEIPRWVRLWTNAYWHGGFRPSRRQAHFAEALCMGGGIVFLAASFLVPAQGLPTVFRVAAAFQLIVGYALSVTIRILDAYRLWPAMEISAWQWRPVRTLRGTLFDYGFVLAVLVAFFGVLLWFAR